ncbi:hypothetical protein EYF80_068336 [Liparis tanakae]|uniref:Uncharacterized protein n=1 Tax=Liparis tanakae TaxID=230148 RepID=A0A4Z2DZH4_9TELE|nr:hypothetical protein EYF80_068336 [Liparis tanakae]
MAVGREPLGVMDGACVEPLPALTATATPETTRASEPLFVLERHDVPHPHEHGDVGTASRRSVRLISWNLHWKLEIREFQFTNAALSLWLTEERGGAESLLTEERGGAESLLTEERV